MTALGFWLLPAIMLLSLIMILRKGDISNTILIRLLGFLTIWIAYLIILTQTGVMQSLSMPPRVPLLIIVPIIGLIIGFTNTSTYKALLSRLKLQDLVYIQSFRIVVELLIYGAFLDNLFPQRVTFEGLNYDILVGISALLIGFLVQRGKINERGLMIWNIASLLILSLTAFAFISSFYFTDFVESTNGEIALVTLPYIWLPGILLPTAIFFHVSSIRQCLAQSSKK